MVALDDPDDSTSTVPIDPRGCVPCCVSNDAVKHRSGEHTHSPTPLFGYVREGVRSIGPDAEPRPLPPAS